MTEESKKTVLYDWHRDNGARMVPFGGWEMPVNYAPGILQEHLATRKGAGLFDVSHMGRFRISGEDALPFLQSALTNDASALEPGMAQYTIIPDEAGAAIDDAYLYRHGEESFLLVVNASNTEKDFRWLSQSLSRFPKVKLEDITSELFLASLQGPNSKAILEKLLADSGRTGPQALPDTERNSFIAVEIEGYPLTLSRTGYTGEPLSFELFTPRDFALELWRRLVAEGKPLGLLPAGLGARDSLRLEAGYPLYGHEFGKGPDGRDIPIFAVALSRFAVSFSDSKGGFVGHEALLGQSREMTARLRGELTDPPGAWIVPRRVLPIAVTGRGIARQGHEVFLPAGEAVGRVTSGTMVPYWKFDSEGLTSRPTNESGRRAIALAYVRADLEEGQELEVRDGRRSLTAVVVKAHLNGMAPPYARPIFPKVSEEAKRRGPRPPLEEQGSTLVHRAVQNHKWRQAMTVNLIPSEITPSPVVRFLSITDPSGRYAEHRAVEAFGKKEVYYYQGTKFIQDVEDRLVEAMREFLDCTQVECRVLSGQMANAAVFSALTAYVNRYERYREPLRLRRVLNHHLGSGGHLSAQPMGALKDFVARDPLTQRPAVTQFPVLRENPYRVDVAQTLEIIEAERPELVIFGKSMMLHPEPVHEIAQAVGALSDPPHGPILMYDMAHPLGLYGPHFQEPLVEGADVLTGSTHKTFFGTQRGIVASNIEQDADLAYFWDAVTRRTFPGSVSNHHLGTLLGLLMATYEMNAFRDEFAGRVVRNAKAFARALKDAGLNVEGDPSVDYTETHQVIIRLPYANGPEVAEQLEENNIIVNYQALPDDESFTASSGLRLGVQEMTRFGMAGADFRQVAGLIAEVILGNKKVGREVASFRERFLKMHFCLPEPEAEPLVASLLAALTG
ncbi:MAG: glycine cleavage system aminomethyltransferase GcvT [Nitrospinota bacterium]